MPKVKYTAAKGLYQESGSGLDLTGDLALTGALSVASTLAFSNKLVGSLDTRSGAGAVSLNTLTTLVATGAGAAAITLAAGATGQLKVLVMSADGGGDATLTPAGGILSGATTIVFNDLGDSVILVYTGTKWAVVTNNGCTIA